MLYIVLHILWCDLCFSAVHNQYFARIPVLPFGVNFAVDLHLVAYIYIFCSLLVSFEVHIYSSSFWYSWTLHSIYIHMLQLKFNLFHIYNIVYTNISTSIKFQPKMECEEKNEWLIKKNYKNILWIKRRKKIIMTKIFFLWE